MDSELRHMSVGDHLDELQMRLKKGLYGFAAGALVGLWMGRRFLALLVTPYERAVRSVGVTMQLQAIQVAEPFTVYLHAAFLLGLLVSAPWLFYQIWAFVAAGLYRKERQLVRVATPLCTLLFASGVFFFLLGVAPLMFRFFLQFNPGVDYLYQPQLSATVRFTVRLALVFGLAFQTPIALILTERVGLITTEKMQVARKSVFVGTFALAAAVTPPDVISQFALALPLYGFYEVSIQICRQLNKRQDRLARETD